MATRTEIRAAVRATLASAGDGTDYSDALLNQCIARVVADVDRFFPVESVLDVTLGITVTDEDFTSDHDTAVSLAYKPIHYGSEAVETTDGETSYTRDTDYTMDYMSGTITVLSTGDMSDSTEYHISYKRSYCMVDIADISTRMAVVRVDYPYGNIPQAWAKYHVHGDILTIDTSGDMAGKSQDRFSENKHAHIYYQAPNTAPTDDADGTYPAFLDEIVVVGVAAYALMSKASELELYAWDDALNDADGDWTTISDTVLAAATTYLTDGDDYINAVNIGASVGELYASYSEMEIAIAKEYAARRQDLIRIGASVMELANAYRSMASARRAEYLNMLQQCAQVKNQYALVPTGQPP